jgi:hypothetical protein
MFTNAYPTSRGRGWLAMAMVDRARRMGNEVIAEASVQ